MRYYLLAALTLSACQPLETQPGPQGPAGPQGAMGAPGRDGSGASGPVSGSRIQIRRTTRTFVADDGMAETQSVSYTPFDTKTGTTCAWKQAEDGKTRCLPGGASASSYYLDRDCKQVLYITGRGTACGMSDAPPVKYVQVVKKDPSMPCVPTTERTSLYWAAENFATSFYSVNGDMCSPMTKEQNEYAVKAYRFYLPGDPIPYTDFVAGSVQTKQD